MSLYFCACLLRLYCLETKEDRQQRLEFIEKQLDLLTMDCKAKIKRITEEVERQVRKIACKIATCDVTVPVITCYHV